MVTIDLNDLDVDRFSGVIRVAAKPWRCTCADRVRRYRVRLDCQHGTTWSTFPTLEAAEAHASTAFVRRCHGVERPDATAKAEVEEVLNPDYRPDCKGDIAVGERHLEYRGEAGVPWEAGSRYCEPCALAVWGDWRVQA